MPEATSPSQKVSGSSQKPGNSCHPFLSNFIKYCLGYIKIAKNNSFRIQHKNAINLPKEFFNLNGLLNSDLDGAPGETIKLDTFYALDTRNIPADKKIEFEKQKSIATKIEDIYNKYRNYQYTKQTMLHFGYFTIELPPLQQE